MSFRYAVGAPSFVLFAVSLNGQAMAQSTNRAHLGLEASVVNSVSTEGEVSGGSDYSSGSLKYKSSSTTYGLPGTPAISLGVLIGDNLDIGGRFSYTTNATTTGETDYAMTTDTTALNLLPYVAYLAGDRSDTTRFIMGLTAGIGHGTSKISTKDSSSASAEGTYSSTQWGAFFGFRSFFGDLVSLDPSLMLMKQSATIGGDEFDDVDVSGLSFMFNLGISLWSAGNSPSVAPPKPTATAPLGTTSGATTPPVNDVANLQDKTSRTDYVDARGRTGRDDTGYVVARRRANKTRVS